MLTLTRRAGESIVIGDTVRVTVKEVRGRNVKLMISAPAGISIFREEIYRAIEAENRAAAMQQSAPVPAKIAGVTLRLADPSKEKEGEEP